MPSIIPVRARLTASIAAALGGVDGIGAVLTPGLSSETADEAAASARDQGTAVARLFSMPDQAQEPSDHGAEILTAGYEIHLDMPPKPPSGSSHERFAAELCARIYQLYAVAGGFGTGGQWADAEGPIARRTELAGGLGGLFLDEMTGQLFSAHAFTVTYAIVQGDPFTPA